MEGEAVLSRKNTARTCLSWCHSCLSLCCPCPCCRPEKLVALGRMPMLPVTFTFFLLPNTLILAPFGTRGETRASYRPRQRVALHYRMLGMHSSFFLPFSDCFASATGLKKIFHVLVEFHPAEGTELQFIRDPPKCGRPLYRVSEIVLAVRTSEPKEHEQHATHESRKSREHKWRQPGLLRLCAHKSGDA